MAVTITVMTSDDIDFAISLTDHERWGNVPADFSRLIAIEPQGCFVARDDEQRVGMVTTTTGGDYAFLGSLIVHPAHRGEGTGESLMRHALGYLRARQIKTVELDATFPAASLYCRLGFRDKYLSLRFVRPASDCATLSEPAPEGGDPDRLFDAISRLDARLTGLSRRILLKRFVTESAESILVYPSTMPKGYARVYPRAGNHMAVGPLVAEDDSTAALILDTVISRHPGSTIGMGLPEVQQNAVRLVRERGFLYRPPSLRMYLGDKVDYESSVYGIVSPEKG